MGVNSNESSIEGTNGRYYYGIDEFFSADQVFDTYQRV